MEENGCIGATPRPIGEIPNHRAKRARLATAPGRDVTNDQLRQGSFDGPASSAHSQVSRDEPASKRPLISLVVAMYNEADGIGAFFRRIEPVMRDLVGPGIGGHEIICVDDGSSDGTLDGLLAQRARNPAIKIVRLSRNFGKEIALSAGLDYATGSAVIPIDADLQDPPELIPSLVAKWLEGYDVVYAVRCRRGGDSFLKRLTAHWFYRIYNSVADRKIPTDAGDFRLMDHRVVEVLRRMPERNRFMKGLFSWVGFRQTGVTYAREPRARGRSKWRWWRLWNFALDGIASSSTLPLRIWTYLGLIIALGAFAYGVFLIGIGLLLEQEIPGYTSLMVSMLLLGGINLIILGIFGEYLGRIYNEGKRRPLYVVDSVYDAGNANTGFEWNGTFTPEWQLLKNSTGGSPLGARSLAPF